MLKVTELAEMTNQEFIFTQCEISVKTMFIYVVIKRKVELSL
jgi:hypothetical protein